MPLRMAVPAAELTVSNSKNQKNVASKDADETETKAAKKNNIKTKNHQKNVDNSDYLKGMIIFLVGCLTSALITRFVPLTETGSMTNATQAANTTTIAEQFSVANEALISKPTYAMYTFIKDQTHLLVIRKLLKMLGYTEVGIEDDWNLLWGFETPFPTLTEYFQKMGPHQIVNHMPGMNFITHKADLSTSGSLYMPPAFRLPTEKEKFLDYAEKNPDKLFVEKNNNHREVFIKKPNDINLESNTTFVQEFLMNPYLVDGYKFDIGVYTVITSIDPLRLYIYTGDVMFRYCQEKFNPFDPNVLNKYVVGDHYRPTWKVPSLKKYFTRFGGGMRASFDAYVRDQGQDPIKIWEQAEEVIRHTVLSQAENITAFFKEFPTQNFFEFVRVDMIIDTNLKVHLIEINLSPNMHSRHFKYNQVTFEQALFNTMRLVGIGSPIKEQENFTRFDLRLTAVTADKSVATNLNECVEHDCNRECDEDSECNLCLTCLDEDAYDVLAKTQREHLHRGDMKRIFPKPIYDITSFNLEEESKNLTKLNKWLTKWFYHKCLFDRSWCQ